jgi:hypothetical protein
MVRQPLSRKAGAIEKVESLSACYASPIETFIISPDIDATKVSVSSHFGHSKVHESKPGLSGSMIRDDIIAPHFGHRGLLIRSANIAYPPFRS